MANYKWVSEANSFVPYETEYETIQVADTDENDNPIFDENGEPITHEEQREISPTVTLYTEEQVSAIFTNRTTGQVIKDVNGLPTAVEV